jgi:hypothetical protein
MPYRRIRSRRQGRAGAETSSVEGQLRPDAAAHPSLKEVLLRGIGIAGDANLEAAIPRRGKLLARPIIDLDA